MQSVLEYGPDLLAGRLSPRIQRIAPALYNADDRSYDGYEQEIIGTRRLRDDPQAWWRISEFVDRSAA